MFAEEEYVHEELLSSCLSLRWQQNIFFKRYQEDCLCPPRARKTEPGWGNRCDLRTSATLFPVKLVDFSSLPLAIHSQRYYYNFSAVAYMFFKSSR